MQATHLMIVGLAGGLGSIVRYMVGLAAGRLLPPGFPWGTLAVNVVGSLAMGVAAALLAARTDLPPEWRLAVTTGFLGGFTTLSAFSADAVLLAERGAIMLSATYVAATVGISIAAFVAGQVLARGI